MKIAILQTDIVWADVHANLKKAEALLTGLIDAVDLIVLPETFSTGFTMKPRSIPSKDLDYSLQWMQNLAKEKNSFLIAGQLANEDGSYYNRLYCFSPEKLIAQYDKRHLFSMAGEHKQYVHGKEHVNLMLNEWRLTPYICYDLRFPVWMRNDGQTDLIMVIANWPAARNYVWQSLLIARAIENQCYVLGVNRVGADVNGVNHVGNSMLVDAKGHIIHALGQKEEMACLDIDKQALLDFREKFPVLKDADQFNIKK